jgi:hypothetical protein
MSNGRLHCPFMNKPCIEQRCALWRQHCAFFTIAMALVGLEFKNK